MLYISEQLEREITLLDRVEGERELACLGARDPRPVADARTPRPGTTKSSIARGAARLQLRHSPRLQAPGSTSPSKTCPFERTPPGVRRRRAPGGPPRAPRGPGVTDPFGEGDGAANALIRACAAGKQSLVGGLPVAAVSRDIPATGLEIDGERDRVSHDWPHPHPELPVAVAEQMMPDPDGHICALVGVGIWCLTVPARTRLGQEPSGRCPRRSQS